MTKAATGEAGLRRIRRGGGVPIHVHAERGRQRGSRTAHGDAVEREAEPTDALTAARAALRLAAERFRAARMIGDVRGMAIEHQGIVAGRRQLEEARRTSETPTPVMRVHHFLPRKPEPRRAGPKRGRKRQAPRPRPAQVDRLILVELQRFRALRQPATMAGLRLALALRSGALEGSVRRLLKRGRIRRLERRLRQGTMLQSKSYELVLVDGRAAKREA